MSYKLFSVIFSYCFFISACANPAPVTANVTVISQMTVTLTPPPTLTQTATPAFTETLPPASTSETAKFDFQPLPKTPEELAANSITAEELIKLAGSRDRVEMVTWFNKQAAIEAQKINEAWGNKPRANGFISADFGTEFRSLLPTLDKKANGRTQVPIQVIDVLRVVMGDNNLFDGNQWTKIEKLLKSETEAVLIRLAILTNVIGPDGNYRVVTATGITNDWSVFVSPDATANWDKWQNCTTNDGDNAPTIGFAFGTATGDGLANGYMKSMAYNFDANGKSTGKSEVGIRWYETGLAGIPTDPNYIPLKTNTDVDKWQKRLDAGGPYPIFCVKPENFNKLKSK